MMRRLILAILLVQAITAEYVYDEEVVSDYYGENNEYHGNEYGSSDIYGQDYNVENRQGSNDFNEQTTATSAIEYHYNENKTINKVHQHHDALIALYGSEESVFSFVYRNLRNPDYLKLYKVKLNIKETLNDPSKSSELSSTQIEELGQVIDILNQRMSELESVVPQSWLTKTMAEEGDRLNAVLSSKQVYRDLNEILSKVIDGEWRCNIGYLVRLWKDVVDTHRSDCDLQNQCNDDDLHTAIEGVVNIVMALENVTIHRGFFVDPEKVFARNKFRLIYMLSQNKNRQYATKIIGSVQELEDLIEDIMCKELTLQVVETVLKKLTKSTANGSTQSPFGTMISNTDDMLTLVDIQTTLGDVTKDVTAFYNDAGSVFRAAPSLLGQHILESYMDLVNNAVNINSSAIWAQMSLDEVSEKLHQMLLTNERYVGTVSDVILSEKANANEKNYTLEKDSLSVSISRVEFQQNSETIAQFKYDDTFIWTDDIGTLNRSEGEDLKVYALRYKSWSHMIREILIKQSELTTNSSVLDEVDIENHSRHTRSVEPSTGEMTQNKSFIGEGGVVSLSTKQNGVKRSVPVTYWIRFDEETFLNLTDSSDKSNSQVCLSCEYLEAETISWKSKGCHVVSADKQGVTCKCNHTTNFAAFMMPAETMFDMTEQESLIFDTISIIGSALSVVGLLASLTIFYWVRHLVRNERFKAHTNLSLALLGVHILFLMGDIFLKNNTVCVISTVLTHYFLLASFMWMLVEGIFLYLYVVQVFMRSKIASYNWMYAVGWLIPVLIVAIAAGYGIPHDLYVMEIAEKRSEVEITPQCPKGTMPFPPRNEGKVTITDSGEQKYERCWLSTSNWMIWSFLIPAILVLVFNSIIMCKTLHICVTSLKTSSKIRSRNKMYNNGSKSSPPRSSSSSRYASGQASSIEEQQHFGTYDRLHGQAGNGKTTPTRVPIVVSTSPCLLQVTTEEEECKQGIKDIKEDDSVSSTESLAVAFKTKSLHPHSNDNKEVSAPRFQTESGDSTRLYNSRTSVMYRNSVSCSPKVKVRSPSFNNKNAPLESTDKYHFFQDAKTAVKGALVLLPILGVPWVCGFLAHFSQVFTMLFIILNSTQGIAIFIVYCLFNGEVRRAIHRRLEKRNMKYAVDNGRRRTSSTSTVARSFLRFGRRRSTVTTTA